MMNEKQVFGIEMKRLRFRDETMSHQNGVPTFHQRTDRGHFCRFLRYRDETLIDIYHKAAKKKHPPHEIIPSALRANQRRSCARPRAEPVASNVRGAER
jgi:hypothetical protein